MTAGADLATLSSRSGSLLIIAVVAVSVVTMIALSLAARLRSETTASDENRYRRETRQACRNAVLLFAADHLVADTNGWDALVEDWAEPWERRDEGWVLRVSEEGWQARAQDTEGIQDESGLVPLNADNQPLLASLLHVVAGLSESVALSLAETIVKDAPYVCQAQLAATPGLTPEAFAAIAPFVTFFPADTVNLNTAPEKVLLAVFAGAGTQDAVAAHTLSRRILAFRDAGNYFTSSSAQSVAKSLGGLPSPEMLIFTYCQNKFGVESDIFSGVAEATPARFWESGRRAGRAFFTYDRKSRRFLRWVEE